MSTEIKILIAEHDLGDIELLHHELKSSGFNYVLQVVKNEQDYADALKSFKPDIILADYTFPAFDGLTAFKIKEEIAPDIPFIFVSGTIGEEKSIELIKRGVTDYALKEKLFTLNIKIRRALREAEEKREKKRAELELFQSERLLAEAQQIAHMGSWEYNFATKYVQLSDEACRIYGLLPYQKKQSLKTLLSLTHSADIAQLFKKLKSSLHTCQNFSVNYRIVRRGLLRYIYLESKVECDSNGTPFGFHGIAHDITQTVLLEIELAAERRKMQSEITSAVLTAQENERSTIGKELNENLNQVLGAIKLHIELAKTDDLNRQLLLDNSSFYLVNVMEEIKKISKTLGSPDKQVGLFNSIRIMLDDLSEVHPIKIRFYEDNIEEGYLGEQMQLTIFRIVQEHVNNILKYSNATWATINLSRQDNEVLLVISDNEKRFDSLTETNRAGLRNIQSRTDLYNGTVTITSDRLRGYTLKVTLPLNPHTNKSELLEELLA